jgi:hypothetical protein
MKTPKDTISKKAPTGEKLRRWRVSILRARAQNLGTIEAPDRDAAKAEAVKLFELSYDERRRLFIWERE